MRRSLLILAVLAALLSACGTQNTGSSAPESVYLPAITGQAAEAAAETTQSAAEPPQTVPTAAPLTEAALPPENANDAPPASPEKEESSMQMKINDIPVSVQWERNESVAALTALVREAPLTITMSPYGGFEQVGPIGRSLPRQDAQTVTASGDIVLYSGNQIVVFYGSNTWAYTRLGRITDKTPSEMAELLGSGAVTITIGMEDAK